MDYLIVFIGGMILGSVVTMYWTKGTTIKQLGGDIELTSLSYTREDADRIRAEVIRQKHEDLGLVKEPPGMPIVQDLKQKARTEYRTMWGPKERREE